MDADLARVARRGPAAGLPSPTWASRIG